MATILPMFDYSQYAPNLFAGTQSGGMPNNNIRIGMNGWERFDPATLTWVPIQLTVAGYNPSLNPSGTDAGVGAAALNLNQQLPQGMAMDQASPSTIPGISSSWNTAPIGMAMDQAGPVTLPPTTPPQTIPGVTPVPRAGVPSWKPRKAVGAMGSSYGGPPPGLKFSGPATSAAGAARNAEADYNSQEYADLYASFAPSTQVHMRKPGSAETSAYLGKEAAGNWEAFNAKGISDPFGYAIAGPGAGFADGGPIEGPGGPRDDNLMIRASDGEFVIPADVVAYKGQEFFDRLISKSREAGGGPKEGAAPPALGFADGGLVTEPDMDAYLQPSGSAGLETLPALGAPPPASPDSLGLAGPVPLSETEPIAPPAAPAPAAPATSGLGLADFKAARSDDDKAYLQSLPAAEKVGLVLQAFGAGVNGGPDPIERVLEGKRRRESEFRNELRTNIATITAGIDAVKKLPPGKARDAMIEQISRTMGPSAGDISEALKTVGTDNEAALRSVMATVKNPRVQKMLTDAAIGATDPRAEALRLMSDKDFMDRAEKAADTDSMPSLTGKLRVISQAMGKMGLSTYTFAELAEQNAKLPKEFQLDDAEMGAARRNQEALQLYGLKSEKMLAEERAAAAKREEGVARSAERKDEKEFAVRLQEQANQRTALMIEGARADNRRALEADKRDRAADKDIEKKVTNLGKALETAKLNETVSVLSNVEALIEKNPDNLTYVTGTGTLVPDFAASKEVTDLRQAVAKLFNIELKNRSGAAVTAPEFERLKDEYGKGAFKKPEQLKSAIAQARKLIEGHYRGVAASYGPEALKRYNENLEAVGGTPVINLAGGDSGGDKGGGGDLAAKAKAAWGSYDPAKYDYRMVGGKLQRKLK